MASRPFSLLIACRKSQHVYCWPADKETGCDEMHKRHCENIWLALCVYEPWFGYAMWKLMLGVEVGDWAFIHSFIHSFICNCCVFQPICCMSQQVRRESVGHFRRGRRCLSVGRRYAAWKSIWEACSTGDGWILVLTNVTKGGETKSLINRTYDSRRDQLHGHQGRKWSHCNLLRHHTYDLPHTYLQSHTCFVHIRPIDEQRLQEVKVHHIPNKVNWREETAR